MNSWKDSNNNKYNNNSFDVSLTRTDNIEAKIINFSVCF